MNTHQRIAVIVAMVVALGMLTVPPWGRPDRGTWVAMGYAPLFAPPVIRGASVSIAQIAWPRFFLQIVMVVTATGIAFVTLGGDKKEPPTPTTDTPD